MLFAFVVAGCASLLLYRLTVSHVSTQAAPAAAKAIVATHNLELGSLIRDTDIRDANWPGALPAHAVLKKEDIIGRGVMTVIFEGEPILDTRLAPKGAGGGLAAMIPSGMRAVAVRVNDVVGVAGFVVPGMRVDVLISGNPPGAATAATGSLTKTLLQNIEVLSAGQDFKKDAEGKPVLVQVVNLLVTPEQAEMLSLAASETHIQLVLRNPMDTQIAKTSGTAISEIFAATSFRSKTADPGRPTRRTAAKPLPPFPEPVFQPAPSPEIFTMEVLNGDKKTESKFELRPEAK